MTEQDDQDPEDSADVLVFGEFQQCVARVAFEKRGALARPSAS